MSEKATLLRVMRRKDLSRDGENVGRGEGRCAVDGDGMSTDEEPCSQASPADPLAISCSSPCISSERFVARSSTLMSNSALARGTMYACLISCRRGETAVSLIGESSDPSVWKMGVVGESKGLERGETAGRESGRRGGVVAIVLYGARLTSSPACTPIGNRSKFDGRDRRGSLHESRVIAVRDLETGSCSRRLDPA